MATIKAGHKGYFDINSYALTGTAAKEVALHLGSGELDASTIGQNWKEFMQGQAEATIDASGVWDAGTAATALDALLWAMINAGGTKLFEFVPGGSVNNETKYTGNCICTKYDVSDPLAGVVGFSGAFRVAGSVTRSLVT